MTESNRLQGNDSEVSLDQRLGVFQRFGGHFQGKAVSGLLDCLPIVVPFLVIKYVGDLADYAIMPIMETAVWNLSGGAWVLPNVWGPGLVLAILGLYIFGLLGSTRVGRRTLSILANVLGAIPLVKWIHRLTWQAASVTRQATNSVTSQFNFRRVVFLEWPGEGMTSLGFVTGRALNPRSDESLAESLAVVYIPTVPNPTSGNMVVIPEDELIETDLSVEEAMKIVFSGGIVLPDTIALGRLPAEFRVGTDFQGVFEVNS